MKIFVLWFILLTVTVFPQSRPHIELRFWIHDEQSNGIQLRCGIDSAATEGLDIALGEYPMPGHPPDGFHAAWIITSGTLTDLSYADFRPYPDSGTESFAVDYDLTLSPKFSGRGDLLILRWQYPLPRGIDSVILIDRLGGRWVKLQFGPQGSDTIRGDAVQLERFIVRVFYTPARVLSVEQFQKNHFVLQTGTILRILCDCMPSQVYLTSLDGRRFQLAYYHANSEISAILDGVSPGWYAVVLLCSSGEQYAVPIVVE
ncbi:MAG: hypothetical protein NZ481_09125 [Candidatus Kapabacteria bacterium]|nr:hypothetical protein [Candidatus Kapabacteria bacterium]